MLRAKADGRITRREAVELRRMQVSLARSEVVFKRTRF
jgi:hypothetical protein